MAKTKKKELDLSTEERIIAAARKLFTKKGFAATRTRDISEEAGINLALLNYYYGSKEKLFEIIMSEILQKFFHGITQIFNDEKTSLEEKLDIFIANYTGLLKQQPDLPLFVFHELRQDPQRLATKMGVNLVFNSYFFKQLSAEMDKKKIARLHPLHYVINMIAMCVFPYIGAPVLKHMSGMDNNEYDKLIEERRQLVPRWMKSIMQTR